MPINNPKLIAINFLPLTKQVFDLDVFIKKIEDHEKQRTYQNVRTYKLPDNIDSMSGDYVNYYVSMTDQPRFIPITVRSNINNALTVNMLFSETVNKCRKLYKNSDYIIETGIRKNIRFKIGSSKEGDEEIWLEPFHLNTTNEFGYLLGFHFRLAAGQQFNKLVLQKCLSLGSDGRENINYYADNYKKIQFFINHFIPKIFPLSTDDKINITTSCKELISDRLQAKKYIFNNDEREASQFQGIKKYGPLETISNNSLICFMYRTTDKPLSYELYHALKGDKYATFSGMEEMFSFSLGMEHTSGISLPDYSEQAIASAINQIKGMANNRPVLPLLLVPWSRLAHTEEENDTYFRIKHQFLSERMPSQFVSLQRIRGRDGLKWSISNIGLGIFSKLGGMPWKLQPTHDKCLIIGIGQSHRIRNEGGIERYYAYSVLSDSSGLYDSIKVLSKSENKDQYLNGLAASIKQVILDKATIYERFVIHTSFKLRIDEVEALTKGLKEVFHDVTKEIVVLKFNDNSRYLGFSLTNNSKVPFESTCVSLGKKQYMVWFEGLQYHNPTIRRRIARPMHIEFIYSSNELTNKDEINFLQDAINLSGANWRGFNAKTSPISVYYAKIIADYISRFDKLGLPEIDIENLPPWFL